jgi:hypothetical protein
MQAKFLEIISIYFDITVQLLTLLAAFIKYSRKLGIQWGSASAIYRLQESP